MSEYTDCYECGHKHSNHGANHEGACGGKSISSYYGAESLGCPCAKTQEELAAYVETFDTRTCVHCGLGRVTAITQGVWSHGREGCVKELGRRFLKMERDLLSRRAAIQDQRERNNGKRHKQS
jgi:hypothetical protein